ncbi:spore germination protein (plasmid) [Bacillus thuringiensis serovar tolworthi]|uniref:Spore germination protein n=1 Tax=Bacillus thuringiensis subsp. tolworthi TaxID=1442 RepID=A0A9W4EY19_BACTO|nr:MULTISPECIES: endospore germination permease [Bacillus cereus group]MEB9482884.1 endospore germination permease [Bacillus cereus]MEB9595767.1 endospore germination permease [Bacillus cereus]MRD27592.1 GerAB/ArcD/ProY family transporter [Bacillus thuringiensis]BAR87703.1 spore germination protein [Bacillus thuringiensis serovar tolworthi]
MIPKVDNGNTISLSQFIFIIHGAQVGTGILFLPRTLAEKSGTDGWLVLPLCYLFSTVASIAWIQIARRYSQQLLNNKMGGIIKKTIVIIYIVYFSFYAWVVILNGMLYIKGNLLPKTPDYFIIILFLIPTYLVVSEKIYVLGRYSEIVFYLTIWIVLLFLIPLKEGIILNMLPIFKNGIDGILNAFPQAIFPFTGFEIVFCIYPYLMRKQDAIKGIVIANSITLVFYIFMTLSCFIFFSPDEITSYNQPVLSILKIIEVSFLERFDLIIITLYLFVVFTAWIPYIYAGLLCIGNLTNQENNNIHICIFFLCIILSVFFIHPSWSQAKNWQDLISHVGIGTAYIFPIFMLLVIKLRGDT